jgi:hypothetical protein
MVHSCCIVGCAQRQNKAKNISLHRIPSFPEEKRKQWINAIKRKEPWTPTQSSCVCSLHFLQGKLFLIYLSLNKFKTKSLLHGKHSFVLS